MRPIDPVRHANVGNTVTKTRFRLDAASTAHLVGVLTNLYSDRILAFIREPSTNAADSHAKAKNLAPIQVTLPSRLNNFLFAVEDFGVGMSIDELEDRYSAYGASDKRDDDEANGTLGLGSKAPLAYSDSFTIRSRKGGVQVLAVVSKDSDGVPFLGVLDTSSTSEPNGVRIEVPVRERDAMTVRHTAEEFFSYWPKGSVLLNGVQPQSIRDDEDLIWLDDDVAVSLSHGDSYIVQHNVPYPVERYNGSLANARSKGYSVVAFVPSGSVNFPPSREALEYTDRTNEVLRLLDEYVVEAFGRVIRDRVEAAATTYERLRLVNTWRRYVPQVVQDFFGKNGLTIRLGGHGHGWRYRPESYRRKSTRVDHLSAGDIIGEWPIIVGYDLKTLTPKAKDKVDAFFEEAYDHYLLLPSDTNLSVAEGRGEIYTWAEIDAAVPDSKVKKSSGGYKGQTRYSVFVDGRWQNLTLTEAKKAIAAAGAQAAYGTVGTGDLASRVPDLAIFDIGVRQVSKIVRETGAKDAWTIAQDRLALAKASLTKADRQYALARVTHSDFAEFGRVVGQIQDPEFAGYVRFLNSAKGGAGTVSVTLQAYLNLGGTIREIGAEVAAAADSPEKALNEKYPLIPSLDSYYIRRNLDELVIYANAKHSQCNTEAPASPTLRKDQS